MSDLEEALRNIDVFCKTVVQKLVEHEDESVNTINAEPIENLLRRKYVIEERFEHDSSTTRLIPLPQLEEPLIDVFEDENYVKVLMQCRCKEQRVTVHADVDGLEICLDQCRKLNIPVRHLQIEYLSSKCTNNEVLEIGIPKLKASVSCGI